MPQCFASSLSSQLQLNVKRERSRSTHAENTGCDTEKCVTSSRICMCVRIFRVYMYVYKNNNTDRPTDRPPCSVFAVITNLHVTWLQRCYN